MAYATKTTARPIGQMTYIQAPAVHAKNIFSLHSASEKLLLVKGKPLKYIQIFTLVNGVFHILWCFAAVLWSF